jgi:hypothetical protein
VEDPDVLDLGAVAMRAAERVVGLAETDRREEILTSDQMTCR